MKKLFLSVIVLVAVTAHSQQFINAGQIEFEVKMNNYKIFGDGIFADMAKQNLPQFSTKYYNYTFNTDKAIYKFDRYDQKPKIRLFDSEESEDDTWYSDYTANTFVDSKFVFDNTYLLSGALMNINWKLSPTETRDIAGFNCRKATGILFDSVYVFAFYTDEITISGGPMGVHGLPGMIMGITIPRMFMSWIATKVMVNAVDVNKIIAPVKGKKKDAIELQQTVLKATRDWGKWGQQAVWNIFL